MHSGEAWIVQAFQVRGSGVPLRQRTELGGYAWVSRDLLARIRPESFAGQADAEMRAAWRIFEVAKSARPRGVEMGQHSVASFWERLYPDRRAELREVGQWLRCLHDAGDATGLPLSARLTLPDLALCCTPEQEVLARRAVACNEGLESSAEVLQGLPHVLIHGTPSRDALVRVGASVTATSFSWSGSGPRAWDVAYALAEACAVGEQAGDVLEGYGPHPEVTGRQLAAAMSFVQFAAAWDYANGSQRTAEHHTSHHEAPMPETRGGTVVT